MRCFVCLLVSLLMPSILGGSQHPDCVSAGKTGDEVTLTAESWDPVLALGSTLANQYGVNVSIEAPKWAFPGDTEDVAVADPAFS
jgi:hypothetical protein